MQIAVKTKNAKSKKQPSQQAQFNKRFSSYVLINIPMKWDLSKVKILHPISAQYLT
jgi:hypothetical protein